MLRPRPVPLPTSLVVKNGSNTRSTDRRRDADAGVAHRDHDVVARRHLGVHAGIGLVEIGVLGFDREPAAVRHRVARVDRQVEDRGLELVGIDQRRSRRRRPASARSRRARRASGAAACTSPAPAC